MRAPEKGKTLERTQLQRRRRVSTQAWWRNKREEVPTEPRKETQNRGGEGRTGDHMGKKECGQLQS